MTHTMARSVLFLSGHDYRSSRRASIHFFAEASVSLFDEVKFFSTGFSKLSSMTGDPRLSLSGRVNRWEVLDGVQCFLRQSLVHPFGKLRRVSHALCDWAYNAYSKAPDTELDSAISSASVIVIESGLSPIYLPRIRRLNPAAQLIYAASDLLSTIGADRYVSAVLEDNLSAFRRIRVPSRAMMSAFDANADAIAFIPQALSRSSHAPTDTPYGVGRHAVSVGSMLFDARFFEVVAPAFPKVTFHVIGAGQTFSAPSNVIQYGEMPFAETMAYIEHADIGIAPYRSGKSAAYLSDSSLKLRQYGAARLPSVCPHFAVGDYAGRVGYDPGEIETAIDAVRLALTDDRCWPALEIPTWAEASRILFGLRE